MRISGYVGAFVLLFSALCLNAQIKKTSVPLGDAIEKALEKSSITKGDTSPFHIRIVIDDPKNPQSPYQGTIEEWWASDKQWRREVTDNEGLHQTVVVNNSVTTEKDEGDYFPLWLRSFVFALFDPAPDAEDFRQSGATIDQMTLPDGRQSLSTAHLTHKTGTGVRTTEVFSNIGFDDKGRIDHYGSPRYSIAFHNYSGFGKKQVARWLVHVSESRTTIVGKVVAIEDLSKVADVDKLFSPLPASDDRFRTFATSSTEMETLTAADPEILWPSVRSGKTSGQLAMYVSVDNHGQVREVRPLNSENLNLSYAVRDQIQKWTIKAPVDKDGKPIQIDGALGFHFESKIENPIPILTSRGDIERQTYDCNYEPILPQGIIPAGQSFKISVRINEQGKKVGEDFPIGTENVFQAARFDLSSCRFRPYIVNGQAINYGIEFTFTAP